jgi:FlaA1/EpsC-like NDP-sugar epimerase
MFKPFGKHLHLTQRAMSIAHDIAACALAWGAVLLMLLPKSNLEVQFGVLPLIAGAVALQMTINFAIKLYDGLWRYASLRDAQRICTSVGIASAVFIVLALISNAQRGLAAVALYSVLAIFFMGGSRLLYRSIIERHLYGNLDLKGEPVLILGAGDAGAGLLKDLLRSSEWRVEGFLDDDPAKLNRQIHGFPVLGRIHDLPKFAEARGVKHAIIAMPSVDYATRRRVVDICKQAQVNPMAIPSIDSLQRTSGRSFPRVRKIDVEDLLKRDPITLDEAGLHEFLTGKVILVTGAGGSIGSELCRQIAQYDPSLLVLLEQNEYAMYRIEENLRELFPEMPVANLIGDIRNHKRVAQVMHQYQPAIVFHAAAYKHVPLMEETNAWEAVENNVFGTYVVARAAIDYGVQKFVLISSDKAVNPTNVMGATKRLSEMICQALQQTSDTRFEIVRFGNVLGSTGSVIPKFQEQIAKGGPVTVTHPDMVRYFMSISEAAQLVMQAGYMGLGGEIFVLDMGEPVRIIDLARDMIRISQLSEEDIKIQFTGLRPGEKLFEELLADGEQTRATPHPKLRIAKAREVDPVWVDELMVWLEQERIPADAEVRRDLKRWVPEYQSQTRPKLRAVVGGQVAGQAGQAA